MKILAYDTSSEVLTAALARDGDVVCEMENASPARHSAALVPLLEKMLHSARWKPAELDVLAVGVGPGSFTGIRVGVATAKMLAFVWKTKLVGVSSLEALAQGREGKIAVTLDARGGKIYAALFEKQRSKLRTLIGPMLTTPEGFRDLVGNGHARSLQAHAHGVRASAVAKAAHEKARAGRFVTPDALEPLYLYPKDCNATKKKS